MKQKSQSSQRQKFMEAAHKAEANDSEAAFEAKLKKIAKTKPTQKPTSRSGR